MKIRLQATEWTKGEGITWEMFFDWLSTKSADAEGVPMDYIFNKRTRNLWVQRVGDFYLVLIFTVRDGKKWCEMQREDDGHVRINVHRLADGRSAVEFNYFLCHVQTGKGVFAHYHQSCGFEEFTFICRSFYNEFKEDLINARAAAIRQGQNMSAENAKKRAKHEHRGTLKGKVLLTPEELQALINRFSKIKRLEMTFGTVQVTRNWGQPIRELVKTDKQTFTFKPEVPQPRLKQRILQTVNLAQVIKGKVVGELIGDDDGEDHTFHLTRNAGVFEEFEYDDVVDELEFDLEDISDSELVRNMQGSINARPDYFING